MKQVGAREADTVEAREIAVASGAEGAWFRSSCSHWGAQVAGPFPSIYFVSLLMALFSQRQDSLDGRRHSYAKLR